jgi:transcriptional regulator with GAF, ATPase, and Fis domain
MGSPDLHSADSPRLLAIAGPLCGEVIPVNGEGLTIGRDPSNRIALADLSLSRRHCAISATPEPRVRDLGSSNGTFVNGMQVSDHVLSDGDRVQVGESIFLFVCNPAPVPVVLTEEQPGPATVRLRVEDARYLQQDSHAVSRSSARREQALHALLRIATSLNTARSEMDIHRLLLERLSETLPADELAIVAVDAGVPSVVQARERAGGTVSVNSAVVRQALTDQVAVLTPDTPSVLCAPISRPGRLFGAIYLSASAPGAFDDEHLQFVAGIAGVTAIAIENARRLAWLETETERLQSALVVDHNLVGCSPRMARVYDFVGKVARMDLAVLVTGETGTGKELVARAIHANSPRAKGPFVAINCAALTESLLESELFGHERGAFTGAIAQKKGKLELADGGTVFLDEIGELAPSLQSKLLRVLQEHEFERIGGTRAVRVNVRLISATNRVLSDEVAAHRFRADLYHRLNVASIEMPPLRERRDDIPVLAQHFLSRFAPEANRPIEGFSDAALRCLLEYDWPGNVRELENAVHQAIALGSSPTIERDDLPDPLLEGVVPAGGSASRLHDAVRETKKRAIQEAFRQARRSYVETARILGVHPNYLHRLIRTLDLKQALEEDR